MRNRNLVAVAAAAALALPLAACGGTSDPGESNGSTTITFLAYQSDTAMNPVIEAFEAQNPDIKVDMTYIPGAGGPYSEALQTRFAGNQAPDVFQLASENRTDILDNDLALDLSDQDFISNVDPDILSLFVRDGKTYAVTSTAWMGALVYNKDLLSQAGYTEFPSTWEDFVTMGQALEAVGVTPYLEDTSIASGSLTSLVASMYDSQGVAIGDVRINGKTEDTTFVEAWTPALEEWQKAITGGVLSTDTVGLGGDQIKSAFLSGEVAAFRSGNWDLPDLRDSGVNFGVAPFPSYPGGEPYINGGGDPAYAVYAETTEAKKAAGVKFLEFLTSEEGVKLLCEGTGAQSVASTYSSDPGDEFRDVYEKYLKTAQFYWVDWSSNASGMSQTWNTQQQLLIQGQATPQSFAEALDAEFDK